MRVLLAAAVLAPFVVIGLGRALDGPASPVPTGRELERDGDFYRDSAGRQCGLDPDSLAHQEVRDGEITWLSLRDGRVVGFRFDGRTGEVFCGGG
jgi:hypothetical protein